MFLLDFFLMFLKTILFTSLGQDSPSMSSDHLEAQEHHPIVMGCITLTPTY